VAYFVVLEEVYSTLPQILAEALRLEATVFEAVRNWKGLQIDR